MNEAKLPRIGYTTLAISHASSLPRAGVEMIVVSRRLGHEHEAFTMNTCGHITVDQQEDAVSRLDEFVEHKTRAERNAATDVSTASASR